MKSIAVVVALIVGLFIGMSMKFMKSNHEYYKQGKAAGAAEIWREAYLSGNVELITNNDAVVERRFINRLESHNPPEGRATEYGYLEGLKDHIKHTVRGIEEDWGLAVNPNR